MATTASIDAIEGFPAGESSAELAQDDAAAPLVVDNSLFARSADLPPENWTG